LTHALTEAKCLSARFMWIPRDIPSSLNWTVVQAKLLYGSKTWVLSQWCTLKPLESLYYQCAQTIAHCPIHWLVDGTWEHLPTDDGWIGLPDFSTYIAHCKTRLLNQHAKPESHFYSLCSNNSTPIWSGACHWMWWT
jgi:hypothetical protein